MSIRPAADPQFARARTLLYGIGAQKAGTSWLAAYLRKHPEVWIGRGKEMHYWNTLCRDEAELRAKLSDLPESASIWSRKKADRQLRFLGDHGGAHAAYGKALFPGPNRACPAVVGDITPDYARLPAETYRAMCALHPDTRFVFVMRDPVGRMHSGVRKAMRNQRRGEEDDVRRLRFSDDDICETLSRFVSAADSKLLALTMYHETIARLESVVGRERILYLFYESLFTDQSVSRLCRFLDIGDHPATFDIVKNEGNPTEGGISDAFTETALPHVADVYRAIVARFGDEVPPLWRSRAV